jgi:hypothetical protein
MWPFIKPIKLIRYLIVWRINGSLVQLPHCLSADLSLFLGTVIADRLPTRQARPWRKALAPWDELGGLALIGQRKPPTIPEAPWPIEAALFAYPGKLTYGQGELILWELKLLGESADHGLFLEVILPAMEETGSVSDPRWKRQNVIWGRFDIQAVYAARGPRWEPVVSDGRLDLQYRATPVQWAEGLTFEPQPGRIFDHMTWLTPFDLDGGVSTGDKRRGRKKLSPYQVPSLQSILESLITRMSQLLPGKHHAPDEVLGVLSEEERASFQAAIEHAARIPVRRANLEPAPKYGPGRWLGSQDFPVIPHPIIPYLELAAILHVGQQTHLGCGTFRIS